MNRVPSLLIALFLAAQLKAQPVYTLQQCIDSAIAHNIPVRRAALSTETAGINLKQARMNLLPDLNADLSHGINSGKSIDPFTNTYVNQSVNAANYGLRSGLVLFNGGTLQNIIRQNAYAYDASKMELQQAKDNLVINLIQAYLDVLNNEDQVQVATRQAESSQKALDRLAVMNSQGAVKPSDLSDLKGQLMNDQLAILNAKAALETSKLSLSRLMNRAYDPGMRLERINVEDFLTAYRTSADEVNTSALNQFSLVKAVELRTRSSQYQLKATRGQLYPRLTFGASINTAYSSVAENNSGKIPYSSQLKNNKYSSIGLGLTVPIFNGLAARNRVKLADINLRTTELFEEETKQLLRQDIDQAYLNMTNAYERYKVLLEQVNAYNESFRAAEVRFNAGVGTSIDFLTAKDRLDRANINLVNARYYFVLTKKILDYYSGKSQQ